MDDSEAWALTGRDDERADVLAYLDRKIANAQKVIDTNNDRDGSARQMQRGWEIMRQDISAGLHAGSVV